MWKNLSCDHACFIAQFFHFQPYIAAVKRPSALGDEDRSGNYPHVFGAFFFAYQLLLEFRYPSVGYRSAFHFTLRFYFLPINYNINFDHQQT